MELTYQTLSEAITPNAPSWIWESCKRLLMPNIKDRFGFAFNDPDYYSQTPVNPEVFGTILQHLTDTNGLSESNLLQLISKFSCRCTKDEWSNLYQPVLKRKRGHGLSIGMVNGVAPTEFMIKPFDPCALHTASVLSQGIFFPYHSEWQRVFALVYPSGVEILNENFQFTDVVSAKPFQELCQQRGVSYPLVFECLLDSNGETEVIDMFTLSMIKVWPYKFRYQLLEDSFSVIGDSAAEHQIYLGDGLNGGPDDVKGIQAEFTQRGYDTGMIFKDLRYAYEHPAIITDEGLQSH